MNKYELGIKIDQIKKLAAKKEYTEAAAIAKDINWTKVKDWQALATAINVQEAVGDYEEARDRNPTGFRRWVKVAGSGGLYYTCVMGTWKSKTDTNRC